jgi:hypothetical protein
MVAEAKVSVRLDNLLDSSTTAALRLASESFRLIPTSIMIEGITSNVHWHSARVRPSWGRVGRVIRSAKTALNHVVLMCPETKKKV